MSDDMDSTCWSTYWTRCLRKALAAWPMQLILPSPFDETQTPDSLRIGLSENACFAMPVSDFRQKTTRSLICPTTFQAREARSLRSPVQSASSTAVEALQAQFPMFPMFPSQACWNQLLISINLLVPACLRCWKASCTLSSSCVCLPT